ncbi:HNH endonuclease [Caproiciproducens galactitolivorans]|uniref:HNH endonuclease n=1 Tax=Caproiciproducens galactitolivorans TaxID=642589 RepID=UPI003AF3611A
MRLHKQTKACDISPIVKNKVWERDGHQCILCGSPIAMPNAHYIPRSHGGLGIEENIVTLCLCCHDKYDNSQERKLLKNEIKDYLRSKYPTWDESKLRYRKWNHA